MEGSTRKGQREGWSVLGRPCEFSVFYTQKHNLQCCHPVLLITPKKCWKWQNPSQKSESKGGNSLSTILGGSTKYRPCQSSLIFACRSTVLHTRPTTRTCSQTTRRVYKRSRCLQGSEPMSSLLLTSKKSW